MLFLVIYYTPLQVRSPLGDALMGWIRCGFSTAGPQYKISAHKLAPVGAGLMRIIINPHIFVRTFYTADPLRKAHGRSDLCERNLRLFASGKFYSFCLQFF